MELQVRYNNLIQRQTSVKEQEAKGLKMLHDDFDADWKSGDEPHGIMTFTDVMPATIEFEPVRDLAKEIDELKIRLEKVESSIISP